MNESLPRLVTEAGEIAAEAQRTFGRLSADQLNWKPGADEWSIAQCFDHLIRINSTYFPLLRRIQDHGYAAGWRDRLGFLSRLFGSLVLKAVQPQATRKFKAASHVRPAASAIDGGIIARFTAHQQELLDQVKKTAARGDLATMIMASPVAPAVFYSVLDAVRIIVAHERRHMAQADRVAGAAGFPAR